MNLEDFFKKSFLTQNPTIENVLTHYDSDVIDKHDGRFSKKEVSVFIDQSVITIGTILFGNRLLTNSVFKMIDFDKDNFITHKEIDEFLQKDYGLTLEDVKNKRAQEVCSLVDAIVERKKAEKTKK